MKTAEGLIGCVLLAMVASAPAGEPQKTGIVYYQVVYKNGEVRDLDDIPETRKDIRRVTRISRYEGPVQGYELLSTSGTPLTLSNPARTYKNDLRWDGKAWIAPDDPAPADDPESRGDAAAETDNADARAQAKERIEKLLLAKAEELASLEKQAAERRAELAELDEAERAKAKRELEQLEARRGVAVQVVAEYARLVKELAGASEEETPETHGKVRYEQKPPLPRGAAGVLDPVDTERVLPHRVQVWKLPPSRRRRTYRVCGQHAEAGRFGEFRYVAYADTDGDGLPDTRLAVSPAARAERAGAWSVWEFETDQPVVYVGNTWEARDTSIYCAEPPAERRNWTGLDANVFISREFCGTPKWRAVPYLTNLRVRLVNPNPHPSPESPRSP